MLFLLISLRWTQTLKPICFSMLLISFKVDITCKYLLMWRQKKKKGVESHCGGGSLGDLKRDMMARGDSFIFLFFLFLV